MPTIFKKVDVIYDFKTAIAPYINSAIVYSQMPHKLVFKRHRVTGRYHMTYAVFSGEPIQPPEPKFNVGVKRQVQTSWWNLSSMLVGERLSFNILESASPQRKCHGIKQTHWLRWECWKEKACLIGSKPIHFLKETGGMVVTHNHNT